jgi:hydroxymethylbilane synthase
MLLALRPDVTFVELRGNVDTRLRKWQEGQADALVLASAGLDRLNRAAPVHQRFAVDELCPAPGQGALALEVRIPHSTEDNAIHTAVAALNCPEASFATTAERTVLHALGGGCNLPLGAYAHLVDESWHLHAMAVSPDGEQIASIREHAPHGVTPEELGNRAAEALKRRGALELLRETALLSQPVP